MRIAINTRFLLPDRLEGLGLYTHEVCRRMVQSHPEVEFHFLFDRTYDQKYIYSDNVHPHVVYPPARHPWLWHTWFEWRLPFVLKKIKPDVFLSPDGFSSIKYEGKKATVIHDLGFEHFPEHVPTRVSWFYRKFTPQYCETADHIFAVSKTTKQDVQHRYGVSPSKVSVAYNGCREGFEPIMLEERKSIRESWSNGRPYFLFVGALHPRKNIAHLLNSFDAFCEKHPGYKLLITGRKAWMNKDMESAYDTMKHRSEVVFLGYQDLDSLQKVTAAAFACLYPSLFEGFGVPMLESMKCGVPVIASNQSVMPEILNGAGLLIDPSSIDSTVSGMEQLLDAQLHNELSKKGVERATHFSWDRTAEHIFDQLTKITSSI